MANQTEQFLQDAQRTLHPEGSPPPNPDAPLVPFQTDLKLSRDQEKRMIEHAFRRFDEISNELGRQQTIAPNWWINQTPTPSIALASQGLIPSETFFGKRSRFDATWLNDVTWRPFVFGPQTIFFESNLTVPISRRICSQMIARAKNAFYGSDPWFSVKPQPVPEYDPKDDAGIALRVERFSRFKLGESQSNSKASGGRAIERALVLGECPVKTSYVVRDQIFNVEARVLHGIDDQPIRAADGNFITDSDEFADAEDGTGQFVLKRDGITPQPLAPIYKSIPLDRRQVLFEGTKSEPIYYKDFGCPLTAPDVQTADCIFHLYDKPVMEFVDLVVKRGMVDDNAEGRMQAGQRMLALVRDLASNSPMPKAAANMEIRPNDNFSSAPSMETGGPVSEFAEFYMWFDANGDGVAENIMLICDRNTKAPIFYDHVANVTTDGLRPIEIVRINPVEGRWYGLGIMEKFESYQTIIDLLVNRWNFSQSRAGRVDFWNPTSTQEGDRDPSLKMNWGGTYTKKPGMKAEDCLESVYLTDVKFEQIHQMFQFFMQLAVNESGVANANDGQAAGLASSDLATGIISLQESGDELFKPIVSDLRGPLQNILTREIDVTLSNMNPEECFDFLEGNTLGIDRLTPDDVRGLKFKAKIELGSTRDKQQIQMSAAAAALVEKFYMLDPMVQQRVVSFYQQQLTILEPKADAKTVIQPLPMMPMGAPVHGGAPGGPKLGESPGTGAAAPAQLMQQNSQMEGVAS